MTVIGVRRLRQNASRYLALVEAGEEVEITDCGRTVARLVPAAAATRSREALIAAEVLVAAREPATIRAIDLESLPARSLTSVLDEDRTER